jgi:hypothetical protein
VTLLNFVEHVIAGGCGAHTKRMDEVVVRVFAGCNPSASRGEEGGVRRRGGRRVSVFVEEGGGEEGGASQ